MNKKRITFLDFMKGIAVMLVVLSHLPKTPSVYNTLLSFVMLPSFFFASGYLTKIPDKYILRDFLYKRVGKLFVLYAVYMLILPFTSVTELLAITKNPILFFEKLKTSFIGIFIGKDFWFVSCLIVINIIFVLMIKIY